MARYITISGWSKYHRQMDDNPNIAEEAKGPKDYETGYIVYRSNPDGTTTDLPNDIIKADTVTLKNCADILADAEALTGNTYTRIIIQDYRYNDDGTLINRKEYHYSKKYNRLTIWKGKYDLMPVYENWDGIITRDPDALADCLC